MLKKYLVVFFAGLFEQLLFTLYLLSVNQYLILVSSILMFIYFSIYLMLMNYCIKDKTQSIPMLFTYALSAAIGNWIAMEAHIIK
jgi:hypothetical protein